MRRAARSARKLPSTVSVVRCQYSTPATSMAMPGTTIARRQLMASVNPRVNEQGEDQRHRHLRDAAAEVAPAGRGGVRRADHVGVRMPPRCGIG